MTVGLEHYLLLSAVLFAIGLYGAMAKSNGVAILMGIEIMLNAVNLTVVAFYRFATPTIATGLVFALFIMTVAAAEAALGLAILIAIYRNRDSINVEEVDLMKW